MSISAFLFPLLSASVEHIASASAGEFAKSAGKAAFEALRDRIRQQHGVGALAQLQDAPNNPQIAAEIKAALDGANLTKDAELQRLAEALLAALETMKANGAPVAIDAAEIRAQGNQLFRNVDGGIRADTIEAAGDQTFDGITAPGMTSGRSGASSPGPQVAIGTNAVGPDRNFWIGRRLGQVLSAFAFVIIVAVVSPAQAAELRAELDETQRVLEALRDENPDLAADVDAAINAFNAAQPAEVRAAFARIDALIDKRRARREAEQRNDDIAQARSWAAQARLLYSFNSWQAGTLYCRAARLIGDDVWYWIECGRRREVLGQLAEALSAYQEAQWLAAAQDPGGRDYAVTLADLGNVHRDQGALDAALSAYEEGLAIARTLAAQDPTNAEWARAVSVSLLRVGDVYQAQGDLDAALSAHEEGLAIASLLNVGWSRDEALSLTRIGDVRRAQGDRVRALTAYEKVLRYHDFLVAEDPTNAQWARDLSISLNKVDDVLRAQGDLDALAIRRTLVARDPTNTEWAWYLSLSLDRVGDVRRAQGDLDAALAAFEEGLEIRRTLVAQDPINAGWARDLSISLDRIGDVRWDQGDLDAALAAYEESLAIARTLATQDPTNAEWARDVPVSLDKVGDVRRAQGDLDAALAAFEEGLTIRRTLVAQDPTNAEWARNLWVSLWKLAQTDPSQAAAYWAEVVARMEAMQANGTLLPADRPYLDFARSRLP